MILNTGIEHLHAIELPTPFMVGPITVYLADAPGDPLTLIDTGPLTSRTAAVLEADLAQLGYAFSDLERIVVSHAHVDHCGLARDLVDASGAQVWTHPWNVPALGDFEADRDQRLSFYAGLLVEAAVPVEVMLGVGRITSGMKDYARAVAAEGALEEGGSLRLAGHDWQVLHTPGHASGLICLYEPGSGTLLSSDHLLAGISSNPVVEPPPPGQAVRLRSLVVYQESLRRVAAMRISLALPGHGPVIHDVAGLVAQRMAFHAQRLGHVLDALTAGAHTTWEVAQVLFPGRPPLDTFLAVSEVVGHLDVLEMEGKIVAERQDGVVSWRLTP
jgi:glyoxylase-like metal-dependent hydrolase (beta-lactamase superfamily II)